MNYNLSELSNIYDRRILNHSIKRVYRQFLDDYLETNLPHDSILEESDALTFIEFSSGLVLAIYPNTETYSLKFKEIKTEELPQHHRNFVETTTSSFWKCRINKPIIRIDFIEGYVGLFGFLFTFSNKKTSCFYYESQNENVFDALIIREFYLSYGKFQQHN